RITRIIQRLLDFTRRKVGFAPPAEVSVHDLAQSTIELLARQFASGRDNTVAKGTIELPAGRFGSGRVKVRLERTGQPARVAGDPDRLQQVLINLLLNAVQAMPDGASIVVETSTVRRTRPGLEGSAEQDFVTVAVADTGIGIP